MKLLAIDPGINAVGWALFCDGDLDGCGLIVPGKRCGSSLPKIRSLTDQIASFNVTALVAEMPQIYERRKGKGDPNQLMILAQLVGAITTATPAGEILTVRPREWKGTIPKARAWDEYIIHRRNEEALPGVLLHRYRAGLMRVAPSMRHNIADAVGIGLWAFASGKFCRIVKEQ